MADNRRLVNIARVLKIFFLHLYLLRAQILGFAFLWPFSSWASDSPMFRGLRDIAADQVYFVGFTALIFVAFLVCTTNIVLRWGQARLGRVNPVNIPESFVRWGTPLLGLSVWLLFMRSVVPIWTAKNLLLRTLLLIQFAVVYICGRTFYSAATEMRHSLAAFRFVALVNRGMKACFRFLGPGYWRGNDVLSGHRTALLLFLYFLILF